MVTWKEGGQKRGKYTVSWVGSIFEKMLKIGYLYVKYISSCSNSYLHVFLFPSHRKCLENVHFGFSTTSLLWYSCAPSQLFSLSVCKLLP